ncbi:Ref family recombination enhancement nuclease [Rhodanobacter sp. FW106-PBR-R2A-1-13]|uniref:Ref family recombination enhancement nuclease n=1 Tax=Rhodanobacter sp. FW106-PBR-R2A-1-13 TaxID=3454845 RepID=UPI0034E59DBE
MKRSELKRRTPLKAHHPLKGGGRLASNTPLKPSTKRMRPSRSTDTPTAAESERMGLVKRLGCLCCQRNAALGLAQPYSGPCEAHHLLSGGRRIGHDHTIGLCQWHHRAVPPEPMSERDAIARYGPSVATGSKTFHLVYGSDVDLLAVQNAALTLDALQCQG